MKGQYTNESELKLLKITYNEIADKFPNLKIDSFDVVKTVIEHRNCWKPAKIKTILLAESHVFTPDEEFHVILNYPNDSEFFGLPTNYVSLIYCLGYGEQDILSSHINNNRGTPQYWKLFTACVTENYETEFYNVSKTKCRNYDIRIKNKLDMLKVLKDRGVWLVDSCIIGLYKKGGNRIAGPSDQQTIISICWNNYISKIICDNKPQFIIVVGHGVFDILKSYLKATNINCFKIPQPNAKGFPPAKHRESLDFCSRICSGEYIS